MLEIYKNSTLVDEYQDLYKNKQYEEIIEKFQTEKDEENLRPPILIIIGATYQRLNKPSLAKKYYIECSQLDPTLGEAYYNLANIEYSEGLYQKAFDNYNKSMTCDLNSPLILVQMGRCLVGLGHSDDARVLYDNALEIDTNCEQAYIEIAELKVAEDDPDGAIEYFYKALDINPNSSICLFRLSRYFNKLNKPKMALNFSQKAINLGIADLETHIEQARTLKQIGFHEEAIFSLKNVLEMDNQNSEAYFMIGSNLGSLGLHDEAIERFCDAIYHEPEVPKYYQNLGTALSANERFKDSEECLLKAVELSESSAAAHCELGDLYKKMGDFEKSMEQYGIASNLDRDFIAPIIGKLSLSGMFPEKSSDHTLDPNILFKEISLHLKGHNSQLSNDPSYSSDQKSIALISFSNSQPSLFVQALLNGHPEVSTIPGYYLRTWFEKQSWQIFSPEDTRTNWREILVTDICRHFEPMFDASSKKSILGLSVYGNSSSSEMGLDKLGKDKSKSFSININLFKEKLLDLLTPVFEIDQKTCFEFIHEAFDYAQEKETSVDFASKKILYNLDKPDLYAYLNFLSYYPESKILHLIQEPISMIEDMVQRSFTILDGNDPKKDTFILSTVNRKIIETLLTINNPLNRVCGVGGVKLEDLIANPVSTINSIVKWLEIEESPELLNPTFGGHEFLGNFKDDTLANQLSVIPKEKKNTKSLGTKDKIILSTLFSPLLNLFKYNEISKEQLEKNLTKIRPWLDKPLQFEKQFYEKIGNKKIALEDTDSYKMLHKHLVKTWELLNDHKTSQNLVQPILE